MKTTRKGTLTDAIEAVSTIDIIEAFDVPNKTKRGRTYILCPGHDDRHFGSCYVDKNDNGYYCYVCGEHIDKWNMVLKLNGNKKAEACEWFFKTAGLSPDRERQDDPYKKVVRLIKQVEQYVKNTVVYSDTHVCDKIDSSYGRNIGGEYLYSNIVFSNPLLTLYKTDKQMFKTTILRLLNGEVKKISNQKAFYEAHKDECLFIDTVGLVTYGEMALACEPVIMNIETLIVAIEEL